MELWLLRHAHAPWTSSIPDAERPLDALGMQQADETGAWMRQQRLRPDHILVSPAVRTRQTAERVLGAQAQRCVVDPRLYEARLDDLLRALQDIPADAQRVLLVGHNPGMEQLVRYLAPRSSTDEPELDVQPCTLVRLRIHGFTNNGGKILEIHRTGTP